MNLALDDFTGSSCLPPRGKPRGSQTVKIPVSREKWLAPFEAAGIAPGFFPNNLDSSLPENLFTIAVTEKRTAAELERYIECAREALG